MEPLRYRETAASYCGSPYLRVRGFSMRVSGSLLATRTLRLGILPGICPFF